MFSWFAHAVDFIFFKLNKKAIVKSPFKKIIIDLILHHASSSSSSVLKHKVKILQVRIK